MKWKERLKQLVSEGRVPFEFKMGVGGYMFKKHQACNYPVFVTLIKVDRISDVILAKRETSAPIMISEEIIEDRPDHVVLFRTEDRDCSAFWEVMDRLEERIDESAHDDR